MRLHVPSKCIDILVPLLLKKRLGESGQFSTPIATDSSSFSFFSIFGRTTLAIRTTYLTSTRFFISKRFEISFFTNLSLTSPF